MKDKKQVLTTKKNKIMKTRVITLPIAKYEYKYLPAITKSGKISKTRYEFRRVELANEQDFQGFLINYRGTEHEIFVPVAHLSGEGCRSWFCNEKGETIMAIWQHGRYGTKSHKENAVFNWRKEVLVEVIDYCNGQVKDNYKYLTKVLF